MFGALELFNEYGERNVTTNHIAEHLSISPGNLYYHFRNKEEIVRSIFNLYEEELLRHLSPCIDSTDAVGLFEHYMNSIFTLMWRFRFFYSNLPEILSRDHKLHRDYLLVQKQLRANLFLICDTFQSLNLINMDEQEQDDLITTIHFIATNWFSYQSAVTPKEKVTEQDVANGVRQMVSVMTPHATPKGKEMLNQFAKGLPRSGSF
nr:TetR/AcrR family transcriptional regulator [Vibrio sp. S9_S30]